jgi:signal transduction histidine kinase
MAGKKLPMPMHEHFEELSALAAIGQLSEQEHHELFEHLTHCDLCRRAGEEFAFILDQLPLAAVPNTVGDTQALLSKSYREKFLQRASSEGVRFAEGISNHSHPLSGRFTFQRNRYIGAVAIAMICLLALAVVIASLFLNKTKSKFQIKPSSEVNQVSVLRNQAPVGPEIRPSAPTATNSDLQYEVSRLENQIAQLSRERDRLASESADLRQRLASVTSRSELLRSQSEKSDQALSEANAELEKVKVAQAEILGAIGNDAKKIKELSEEVAADEAALTREHELNAATKDVRELMAARNLHIIDVYDYDTRGKRDKSFGRVLYSEHKKLIFYAFDLGKNDSASKLTFQAWGQREGSGTETRNLGVFHIDDHEQRRWVLRVDDPKLLSSVDSVFVTVEPSPGKDKPSGKKLLYAFLGTRANHP